MRLNIESYQYINNVLYNNIPVYRQGLLLQYTGISQKLLIEIYSFIGKVLYSSIPIHR